MSEVKIKEFSAQIGLPVERLLDQLANAGIKGKTAADGLTDGEKKTLLVYLQGQAASNRKTVPSARSRTKGEIRQTSRTGAAKAVQVEVRRKRRVVSRNAPTDQGTDELERLEAEKKQRDIDRAKAEEKRQAQTERLNAEKAVEQAKREAEEDASRQRALEEEQKRQQAADELVAETKARKEAKQASAKPETKAPEKTAAKVAPAAQNKKPAGKKNLAGSELHVRRKHRGNVRRPAPTRRPIYLHASTAAQNDFDPLPYALPILA